LSGHRDSYTLRWSSAQVAPVSVRAVPPPIVCAAGLRGRGVTAWTSGKKQYDTGAATSIDKRRGDKNEQVPNRATALNARFWRATQRNDRNV